MQVINKCEKEALINRTKIKYMMSLFFQRSGSLLLSLCFSIDVSKTKMLSSLKKTYLLLNILYVVVN